MDHLQTLEGKIEPIELEDEMRKSFIDYAMSVIVDRALPDVRDGLKPSQRRILVAMNDLNLAPNAAPQVRQDRRRHLGQLPPARRGRHLPDPRAHGAGLQHALPARRRPGQLRLGRRRPAGGHALHRGALRRIAIEMLRDIDKDTVDFVPNYDETRREPTVLPSRFPNLLVNGSAGIAVGMATNIPPHNLGEIVDAIVHLIDNPEATRRRPDAVRQGARLPDRRPHPRHGAASRRPTAPAAAACACAPRPTSSSSRATARDHRHRAALPGQQGRPHREDRRPGQDQEDHRDLRPARRVGPHGHAHRHRAQARRHRQGGAQQALQAHRRCRRPSG